MATIIGSNSAVDQGSKATYSRRDGERKQLFWRGPAAKIKDKYDELKPLVDSLAPTYDTLDVSTLNGRGDLTATLVTTSSTMGEAGESNTTYEMYANEFSKPVEQAPYFSTATVGGAALTADEIVAVYSAFDAALSEAATGFAGKQLFLFQLLCKGTTEYLCSGYVLRRTQVTSSRSALRLSYTNVNQVETPPSPGAVNAIITSLPAGDWLKKAPNVRLIGKSKYEITQEWWWAEAWSNVLYGANGSGVP